MKAKPKLWVCRDNDNAGWTSYVLYFGVCPSKKRDFDGELWVEPVHVMCADGWEGITGIKLRPGAGPVEVTIPKVVKRRKKA